MRSQCDTFRQFFFNLFFVGRRLTKESKFMQMKRRTHWLWATIQTQKSIFFIYVLIMEHITIWWHRNWYFNMAFCTFWQGCQIWLPVPLEKTNFWRRLSGTAVIYMSVKINSIRIKSRQNFWWKVQLFVLDQSQQFVMNYNFVWVCEKHNVRERGCVAVGGKWSRFWWKLSIFILKSRENNKTEQTVFRTLA